jgi:glycosyltransferase involved in cell wall biosynthesis
MTPLATNSVLHVSAWREDHGGIQSTLRRHHARDAALGFASRFISVFDREATWPSGCASLAGRGWERVGAVRRRFAAAVAPWPDHVAIYHDGWGLDWFAPLDGARRRIVYLHTERPHADELLRIFAPRADGFLSVSRSYADRLRRVVPGFPEERIAVLPVVVEPPSWVAEAGARGRSGAVLRIGYAGRVERGAKRLDRLPAFIAELKRRGVDFQFEVVGDGSYLEELRRTINDPRVSFLGWLKVEDYWRKIAGWDVVVLLSDYEGFSCAVMECMCCGVVPVYPDFAAAAAELLGPAAGVGLYRTGDVAAAAARVAEVAQMEPASLATLRSACAAQFATHHAERYDRTFAEFVRQVVGLPARAQALPPSRWATALPLGVYTRVFPRRF